VSGLESVLNFLMTEPWFSFVRAAVAFGLMLLAVPVMVLFERKVIGWIQERPGPNRVGFYALISDIRGKQRGEKITKYARRWFRNGELQTIVDGIKLFLKEDLVPAKSDKVIFMLAPMMALLPAVLAVAIVPFGPSFDVTVGGQTHTLSLMVSDLPVGILFYLAVNSLAVYGVVLAGWASNSKYSLLGGLRSTAQLISYEITLGLSLIGVLLIAGSFNMSEIMASQSGGFWNWNFIRQPLGFLLFLICGFAETNRLPFDLPEGESELGAGFHTEYSSLRFAMFFMAEYMHILTFAAIVSTLFLGGYFCPVPVAAMAERFGWEAAPALAALAGLVWMGLKIGFLFFFFIWVRGTLPRLRYDQLMALGWKCMFPLALINLVVTAGILVLGLPMQGLWLFGVGLGLVLITDRLATARKRRILGHAA